MKETTQTTLDDAVLSALYDEPRASNEDIAQHLGTSRAVIHYRLRRMLTEGIVRGTRARINPGRIGLHTTCVLLRLNAGEAMQTHLFSTLKQNPQVLQLQKTTGAWDLALTVTTPSVSSLTQTLSKLSEQAPLTRMNAHLLTHHHARNPHKPRSEAQPTLLDAEAQTCDPTDAHLLSQLLRDEPAPPLTQTSRKTCTSHPKQSATGYADSQTTAPSWAQNTNSLRTQTRQTQRNASTSPGQGAKNRKTSTS
ncbi:MAG: Lrp/AsnC family transcriptional regulator [Nitrosarchaeum sp.]|nr:Lrp/AsnC family transcriptional regulator [Nitrosarchaeum sp.]